MSITRRAISAIFVLVLLLLPACGPDQIDAGSTANGGPSVVTALYPLAFVAERVGGEDITLTNLAAPGVEPHDLELAPQQVSALADAALVISLDGFSPALDEAIEQNAADRTLHVDTVVTLMESAGDDGHGHGDEDGDEHVDEEADEHADEDGADHGELDPHFWLDPQRLGELATVLAGRLGEIDPEHAESYTDRAAALVGELDELDGEYEVGLASCDTRMIVTAHAAFGYLADRYGLDQYSVAGLEPDAEPSAARIADVQDEIEANEVTTVYFEPLASSAVVDAIAADLGLQTAELDPVESASPGADYLDVMALNLATLRDGQGCS